MHGILCTYLPSTLYLINKLCINLNDRNSLYIQVALYYVCIYDVYVDYNPKFDVVAIILGNMDIN